MAKTIKMLGLCLLGIFAHISITAQEIDANDSLPLKKIIYKVSLTTTDLKTSTGYLAALSDSVLFLSSSPVQLGLIKASHLQSFYSYDYLQQVIIKRKNAAGRGAWKGALIGLAAGAIAGLISGDDPKAPVYNNPNDPLGTAIGSAFSTYSNALRMTAGEKALTLGIAGAGSGSLMGALLGSLIKRKFIIGKDKQKFQAMQQSILEKLYPH